MVRFEGVASPLPISLEYVSGDVLYAGCGSSAVFSVEKIWMGCGFLPSNSTKSFLVRSATGCPCLSRTTTLTVIRFVATRMLVEEEPDSWPLGPVANSTSSTANADFMRTLCAALGRRTRVWGADVVCVGFRQSLALSPPPGMPD